MHQIAICGRSFGAVLKFSDNDVSLFQDATSIGTTSPELDLLVPEVVAHLYKLMSNVQKEWCGCDNWYRTMMDFIVFGTEENPIEVEE